MVNTVMLITGIIGLVIGILVLTSLGNTVITQASDAQLACGTFLTASANNTNCNLENSSTTGKTMYSLIELLYPIMGVLFIIGVGFALKDKY